MTANAFAFIAVTKDAELRPSKKTGRDYLSLTVENDVIDSESIAVAVWSESLIAEIDGKVTPGTELYTRCADPDCAPYARARRSICRRIRGLPLAPFSLGLALTKKLSVGDRGASHRLSANDVASV
jgi:hypothetical protein